MVFQIEVGTIAPDTPSPAYQPDPDPEPEQHYEDEEEALPTLPPVPSSLDFKGPGLFGPETGLGRSDHLLLLHLQYSQQSSGTQTQRVGNGESPPSICVQVCPPACCVCVSVGACTARTLAWIRSHPCQKTPPTFMVASTRSAT